MATVAAVEMASIPRVFQLAGTCTSLPWGKRGCDSLAARLCEGTDDKFEIEDGEAYSELWFGDYPDFPSRVLETGELLGEAVQANKEAFLGANVVQNFGTQLPFLPKILSIAKALPLQIHPGKELSQKLHEEQPDEFPDPNHKPAIAIALSKFELFAGWKPISDISVLFNVPVLRRFIPEGTSEWTEETLRAVTRGLLKADGKTVAAVGRELATLSRDELDRLNHQSYIVDLLPRLQEQHDDADPGTLVALLCMNFVVLESGESIFIPANGIHAYLSGDAIECTARSNNVLNSGFCPRRDRDDVDLFVDALTFGALAAGDIKLPREKSDVGSRGQTSAYRPPMSEFEMLRIELAAGEEEEIRGGRGPGVVIVTGGAGTLEGDGREFEVGEGSVFFVAPGTPISWRAGLGLQAYMAVV